MFCKNCGAPVDYNAAVCKNCGCYREKTGRFCQNCGLETLPGTVVCPRCGAKLCNPPAGYSQKSKLAAGLLGIFLGSLGVHNFYLGYTGKGLAQLCITVLTCGFGSVVSQIWGIVDAVYILSGKTDADGNGYPLTD